MSHQASKATTPELDLRKNLHRMGMRYRVHIRPLPHLRRTADIAFTRQRVAVFIDGCFWHACPQHRTSPKTNAQWWSEKLQGNIARDAETDELLREAGWEVVRVWEHEDPEVAALRVRTMVRQRQTGAVSING
jgi:DNA mismatch endonuclease (patch repair protein)